HVGGGEPLPGLGRAPAQRDLQDRDDQQRHQLDEAPHPRAGGAARLGAGPAGRLLLGAQPVPVGALGLPAAALLLALRLLAAALLLGPAALLLLLLGAGGRGRVPPGAAVQVAVGVVGGRRHRRGRPGPAGRVVGGGAPGVLRVLRGGLVAGGARHLARVLRGPAVGAHHRGGVAARPARGAGGLVVAERPAGGVARGRTGRRTRGTGRARAQDRGAAVRPALGGPGGGRGAAQRGVDLLRLVADALLEDGRQPGRPARGVAEEVEELAGGGPVAGVLGQAGRDHALQRRRDRADVRLVLDDAHDHGVH